MNFFNKLLTLKTKFQLEIIDLTFQIEEIVKKSRVKNGLLNICSLHTTAAIFINEKERELLKDFKRHIKNLTREGEVYFHDDFNVRTENMCAGECANGHAHCKALHLPTSVTLNLINGKINFGRWQRIFLMELDRSRRREVSVVVLGE